MLFSSYKWKYEAFLFARTTVFLQVFFYILQDNIEVSPLIAVDAPCEKFHYALSFQQQNKSGSKPAHLSTEYNGQKLYKFNMLS